MNEVITPPEPTPAVEPRCKFEELFSRSLIELIQMAPNNPIVRGLILARTGKIPGPDCRTPEAIKEWAETTCDQKSRPPCRPALDREGISVPVEFSDTEYGRASYSVPRSASDEFQLSADELVELIEEAIGSNEGINQVVEAVAEKINDRAWDQCDPSLEDYGDYEYDEHHADDSGNRSIDVSKADIRERLRSFLDQFPTLEEELEQREAA